MHQALYRKWRPQTFSDVCGQEHITSILRYQVENGKTSHAYLFCGSRGTGKTTCAKILAKAVSCEHNKNGDPCTECAACKAAEAGSCIDIIEMDAASNNGVDDIRKIRDEVEYLPAELKYKVYIIDEVHMLSTSAFNALLKTLEEPPPHVIFILATTELQKIPPTILSRCQRYDFKRISSPVIADRLEYISKNEGYEIDREAAFMIAHLAQGGMRDAVSLLELCAGDGRAITAASVEEIAGGGGRDATLRTVNAVLDKNYDAIFAETEKLFMSSRDLTVFWTDLLYFYRDMLVVKTAGDANSYLDLSQKQYSELCTVAEKISLDTLIYHSKLLDSTLSEMKQTPSSKRLLCEMTLVRMCDEKFDTSNEALSLRIASLEDRLNRGEAPKPIENRPPVKPPAVKTETAVKKEYTKLPYWADFVQRCGEKSMSLGAFLKSSVKGFTVNTDNFIHIRASQEIGLNMITSQFATILDILSGFEGRTLSSENVKLEYVPEKKKDSLDEL